MTENLLTETLSIKQTNQNIPVMKHSCKIPKFKDPKGKEPGYMSYQKQKKSACILISAMKHTVRLGLNRSLLQLHTDSKKMYASNILQLQFISRLS